jgi:hypothetical protein
MLIELHTPRNNGARWYWVMDKTYRGSTWMRLVITRMDPSNIVGKYVQCTVYGSCDDVTYSSSRGRDAMVGPWKARSLGFGRTHSNVQYFQSLDAAKVWLLKTVAGITRQSRARTIAEHSSAFSVDYTYEAIGCL